MMLKKEELLPCYLFVHLDMSARFAFKVKNTFGVYGFFNFSGKPLMVPDSQIEEVKNLKDHAIDLTQNGDRVMFSYGSHENVAAIF